MKKFYLNCIGLAVLLVLGFTSCDNEDVRLADDPTELPGEEEDGRRAELYVTNNTDGNITKYDLTAGTSITLETASTAAEGIYYDPTADVVYQASRTALRIDAYSDVSTFMENASAGESFSSSADLASPREMAVSGDYFVVSDNGSNTFFVYQKSGDSFSLANTFTLPFPLWGITFRGKDLYAVVDTTSDMVIFYDFFSNTTDGPLTPSKRITVEGLIRTHGITYDSADDVLVLTDIGDAANATDDGAFLVVNDFAGKIDLLSDGDILTKSHQIRIEGSNTLMGNPIDVAYDSETNAVYISEIGNGKVLGFTGFSAGGNIAPSFQADLSMASSLYFSSDETDGNTGVETLAFRSELYANTTASGDVFIYDALNGTQKVITAESASSEGIYYSGLNDALIHASRSDLLLEYYSDISMTSDGDMVTPAFESSADLVSPREIAVSGQKVVVSDNGSSKFYVYTYTNAAFNLENTFTINCNLWGITFMGDDLVAVVDLSGDIVVFNDFLSNTTDGVLNADKQVTVEGIVRTHGITYSASDDVLLLTDIGDAANTADDGGFQIIPNFFSLIAATENMGTIALSAQIRVSGSESQMGNPIDIAYDNRSKSIFIAEIGNSKILEFKNIPEGGGNIAPSESIDFPSAASVYMYSN